MNPVAYALSIATVTKPPEGLRPLEGQRWLRIPHMIEIYGDDTGWMPIRAAANSREAVYIYNRLVSRFPNEDIRITDNYETWEVFLKEMQ